MIVAMSLSSNAETCWEWTDHLRMQHGIAIVPATIGKNSAWEYRSHPKFPWQFAFPKGTGDGWKFNFSPDGKYMEIAHQHDDMTGLGYGVELNGKECKNSYSFTVPKGLKNPTFKRPYGYHYNWEMCDRFNSLGFSPEKKVVTSKMRTYLKDIATIKMGMRHGSETTINQKVGDYQTLDDVSKLGRMHNYCHKQDRLFEQNRETIRQNGGRANTTGTGL